MSECKKCNDRGYILKGDQAYRCTCWSQKLLNQKIKKSNLNLNSLDVSFSRFELKYYPNCMPPEGGATYRDRAVKALKAGENFTSAIVKNKTPKGLFFFGPVGSGKTFLATAIAQDLLAKNIDVLFLIVPDYLDELRFSYTKDNDTLSEKELVETACNASVLILDDLGAHNYTQWTANKLYTLLNYRLNYNLPTVITSNLSPSELENFLGERTCSRLIGLCSLYRLLVPKDIRYVKSLNEK